MSPTSSASPPGPRMHGPQDPLLGSGRSGVVYKSNDARGRITARKVFDSDSLTRSVQYFFLGAPNPYAWSEHAIQAALLRRRILTPLVKYWLGDLLRVAEAWDADWNSEAKAWQLHTQFVAGSHPSLHHPMNVRGAEEVQELREKVMQPLLAHLLEAGFDGQVWQAGLGNPVALANFMLERDDQGQRRWVWIDLESGVPALFPANPLTLFSFYLPRALRLGHPLFDDVDVPRVKAWLAARHDELLDSLGADSVAQIERDIRQLDEHQKAWYNLSRLERSLGASRAKGRLSDAQVAHYKTHRLRWYARESSRALRGLARRLRSKLAAGWKRLQTMRWKRLAQGLFGFLTSQRYRSRLAQAFIKKRIQYWSRRDQLTPSEAKRLCSHLGTEESSAYLTDFGVHVAIKPIIKSIEWFVIPALFAAGLIGPSSLALILLAGGSIGRTLYTSGRTIQSYLHGRERPWIALGVGIVPVLGNLAYPLQIVGSSHEEHDLLAQFILYDACTSLGRKIPIWGGRDTLSEHLFNHLPDLVVTGRKTQAT